MYVRQLEGVCVRSCAHAPAWVGSGLMPFGGPLMSWLKLEFENSLLGAMGDCLYMSSRQARQSHCRPQLGPASELPRPLALLPPRPCHPQPTRHCARRPAPFPPPAGAQHSSPQHSTHPPTHLRLSSHHVDIHPGRGPRGPRHSRLGRRVAGALLLLLALRPLGAPGRGEQVADAPHLAGKGGGWLGDWVSGGWG